MLEIFRAFGFSFFFYSREHEPIHIHVEGKGGAARYVLEDGVFVLAEQYGLNKSDLRKIGMMIAENSDIIVRYWNEYFNNKWL